MEHLLFWSKCSIFHNTFKNIQIPGVMLKYEWGQYRKKRKKENLT